MEKKFTFSQNLVRFRKAKGLSQYKLAQETGISRRVINYYETNPISHPSIDKINKIAEVLNISSSDLISNDKDNIKIDPDSDLSNVSTKSLHHLKKLLQLNKYNRSTIYKMIDLLLKEQQELEDKNKIKH